MGELKCYYNATINLKPSTLFFKIFGDGTHLIVKNDTIAYYYSKLETLSLQYKYNGLQDIYMSSDETNTPTEILFEKKNDCIYLFIMTARKHNETMSPKLLYSLFASSN